MIEAQTRGDAAPHPLQLVTLQESMCAPLAPQVLACMQFGMATPTQIDSRRALIPLAPIDVATLHQDLWLSPLPVRVGLTDGIHHADNGEILFGWMHLQEAELHDLEQAACELHLRLHEVLRERGFPHWLRAWNYLSDINAGDEDQERYRQFTAGRYRGLRRVLVGAGAFERRLPAATAIGTAPGTGLTVCFFAGRTPGIQVENPRQTSAFEYPPLYGPRSPSFSRATLHHWADRSILFVSGTASIVGHASIHAGDVSAQFEETLRNLDTLVAHAGREHLSGSVLHPRAFKLYLREAAALEALEPSWREALARRAPTALLVGALCRRELLMEIEAVYETQA